MSGLWQLDIVQSAYLAGTIVAIVAAVVGYFVVLRAQAFASHALSHIGFAGATGAAVLGFSSLLGMLAFTLLAALGMGALGQRVRGRDVEIGMLLSFALGLGVLFLSLYTQYASETVNVLFGSILSVSPGDVLIMLFCGIGILLLVALIFRPLLFASVDPEVAQARGVPVGLLSITFMLLLAITISEAAQIVGVLLVFALLIAPAASAERLTRRPLTAMLISVALSLGITWGGLRLAFISRWPASFYIAALAALCYLLAVLVERRTTARRVPTPEPDHPETECQKQSRYSYL
ncbi:MAG: metal ABC transporter permease [Chloroflexota bacterium]|nr:metal ABC transporter permease [Chloroflexota bacterium]